MSAVGLPASSAGRLAGLLCGAAVVAAAFAVALFVQLHSLLQANLLAYGHKLSTASLPLPCFLYLRYGWLGYGLPLLSLILMAAGRGSRKRSAWARVGLCGVGLAALLWLLGCLLAWQIPLYYPVAVIR